MKGVPERLIIQTDERYWLEAQRIALSTFLREGRSNKRSYVQSADLAHMDVERTRKNFDALGVKRCRACSVEVPIRIVDARCLSYFGSRFHHSFD